MLIVPQGIRRGTHQGPTASGLHTRRMPFRCRARYPSSCVLQRTFLARVSVPLILSTQSLNGGGCVVAHVLSWSPTPVRCDDPSRKAFLYLQNKIRHHRTEEEIPELGHDPVQSKQRRDLWPMPDLVYKHMKHNLPWRRSNRGVHQLQLEGFVPLLNWESGDELP